MQNVTISDSMFQGAISIVRENGAITSLRLPAEQLGLFPSPGNVLQSNAAQGSGVRLRLDTDTRALKLTFDPLGGAIVREALPHHFDVTIYNELVCSAEAPMGADSVTLDGLPAGRKVVEVWLPSSTRVDIRTMAVDDGAICLPAPDDTRLRWVTYGSSITHCARAHSPARTWPATVARRRDLHLTCLGYGGECHLEPMVAMMIRDLPADIITLKLGINCMGGSFSRRTFPPAVIGMVRIIREKHPTTPMALISPIACPQHETTPNIVNYTLQEMRADIEDAHQRLVAAGDRNLSYFNGLDIFDEELLERYSPDLLHPFQDGIEVQADRFDRVVMDALWPAVMKASKGGAA